MLIDIVAIIVRSLSFIAMLQASGVAIFIVFSRILDDSEHRLQQLGVWSAWCGVVLVAVHQLLEAPRMTGTFSGVMDVSLHARALFSAVGIANGLRIVGLVVIVLALRNLKPRTLLSIIGGSLVALSFTATGHTSVSPLRWLLAPLLFVHLGVIAFWFGGLVPLYLIASTQRGVQIVARFSSIAIWCVPFIAVAGIGLAAVIVPSWQMLLEPYGLLLTAKVIGFSLLMGLAGLNKMLLGPALACGDAKAITRLRASIAIEFALIVMVLSVTATMTTLFSPGEM